MTWDGGLPRGSVSLAFSGRGSKAARGNCCLVGRGTLEAPESGINNLGLLAAGREIL